MAGLPRSGKNVWQMIFSRSGNFGFQSGKFRKTEKSQGLSEYSKHIVLFCSLRSIISKNYKWIMSVKNITLIIILV